MRRGDAGFSLMEVVIAMAIMAVAIMFSSSSTSIIGSNFQTTRRFAKAHDVAGIVLEELMSVYESDAKLLEGDHTQEFDENGRKTTINPIFTASWSVRPNFPITKIMEIRLHVTWREVGKTRGVHYVTFRGI